MAALNFGQVGTGMTVTAPPSEPQAWAWGFVLVPFVLAWLVARTVARRPGSRWTPPVTIAGLPPAAKLLVIFFLGATALTHAFAAGAVFYTTTVSTAGHADYFRIVMKPLQLLRMSHQHAFGHGTMYFLLGALALATTAAPFLQALGIALTSLGAACDLASWWLQHYAGPDFHPLSVGAGAAFSTGYLLLAGLILRDLARRPAAPR